MDLKRKEKNTKKTDGIKDDYSYYFLLLLRLYSYSYGYSNIASVMLRLQLLYTPLIII